ncbi:peroxisomal biogenesis factor 11 protein [Mucor ambiguus]|uniref:Peroxisomal biogenesis factor 11 protein n=1 Tax=Mucor ambiguus TaxID=91626 RepID=A0A0C9M0A6_9FUNG|nr:peroxisomal biogenesis factor 11 protein [Mucor ambiguus]
MAITEAHITAFNKYLNVTNGREKLCRLVQYFARFYAFYLLKQGASKDTIQRWANLKSHLAIGRKFFRLLKPVELAQSSIKSLALADPVLRATQFVKFTSNFFYFTSEAFSLLDTINFYKLNDAKKVSDFGLKCWFLSLSASIISGLYQLKQLRVRAEALKSEKSAVNADVKGEQNKLVKEEQATTYQLCQDVVDICIPIGGLKWLNLDEGQIGIAGIITSAMAMNTQWKKTNPN